MREDEENMQEEREESENKNGDIEEKEYHQIENEVTQLDKVKDNDETASRKAEIDGKEDQGKVDAVIKDDRHVLYCRFKTWVSKKLRRFRY